MASEPSFPIATFMNMSLESVAPGEARATAVVDENHFNPHGIVHGSVFFTLADTSMGLATVSILPAGQLCSTIEIQVRYLRALGPGRLVVDTRVVKPGRRVVHLESRGVDEHGRLVATATGSYAVLEAP